MSERYLGLDVGTTAVKAAVFDGDGQRLAAGRARTPWRSVDTGHELDPEALLAAALAAAVQATQGRPVHGVGVASMAETGVLLDREGRPVVPSIAWNDARGGPEAERLALELPDFARTTGLPATRLCTLAKYAWMRAHWPAAARGVRWANVADWIVEGFGGTPGAEASLASRTGFYDLHAAAPWDGAARWADAPPGLAPDPAPAATPRGRATVAPLAGAVLAVAGHDHVAAALGAGAAGDGDVFDSCGTAEAIQRAVAPLDPVRVAEAVAGGFTVGLHALPHRHVLQGALWTGERLQAVLAALGVDPEARDALEAAALAHAPHAAPYRAALEELGAAGAELLARMAALAGPARRIVASGGWIEGVAAQAVKTRHFGSFEHVPAIYAGCRGAALTARAAASRDS